MGDRQWRRFSVYDLEWIPGTLQVRIVGYYDGNSYASYATVDSFLRAQLTSQNNGRWFFAHAGGLADVQFIFDRLAYDDRFYLSAAFSGSSAIIVDVQRKNSDGSLSGDCWRFVDSYWLLRDSLKRIGQWLGMHKTGPEEGLTEDQIKHWYATVALSELEDYNEQDCRILWHAINNFETELLALGGELRCTIASCALDLFLRRYLRTELPCNVTLNDWARKSYIASRVEVFQRSVDDCLYYDINSSFPNSMTKLLPGRVLSITEGRLPEHGPYLADVEIETRDGFMPPLPYRANDRIFFPVGKWRAYLMWVDIETLLEAGGRIIAVHDVVKFDHFGDLEQFARDLYEKRGTSEGFQKLVYKYVLNSLYGKFAESPNKQKVHVNPPANILARLKSNSGLDIPDRNRMLMPGIWLENTEVQVLHEHVALSSAITAHSRQHLFNLMKKANETYYCDTDGFAVSPDTSYPTGDALGNLKLEKTVRNGQFYAPKVYRLETSDGKVIHKAKGFSLGKKETEASRFQALVEGRDVQIERMARIKENLKRSTTTPVESIITKRLGETVFPKRCFDKRGNSRAWSVKEVNRRFGL